MIPAASFSSPFPSPSTSGALPPRPWLQMLPPVAPLAASSFWQTENLHDHLRNVRETLDLLKALGKELDTILQFRISEGGGDASIAQCYKNEHVIRRFSEAVNGKRVDPNLQESLSLEAANFVIRALKDQLAPLSVVVSQTGPWEERSAAARLAQKLQKHKRNKGWKKRKRRRIAERIRKEKEMLEQADQDADEWRTREIAKDIARRKVENMKAVAKLKANEERKRLESELELVLVVEKLQELRSIRTQKLKKQGHFLPEEDDKFLERVRAAVEEEERQTAAAADTDAAKDAIATAEESRKIIHNIGTDARDESYNKSETTMSHDQPNVKENERSSGVAVQLESEQRESEGQGYAGGCDSVTNLPFEFYHYYHGSNNDMGTLIEVRRTWDAYIRPTGSRIPGHWVQPPPPADEVWGSYLVGPQ